MVRHRNMSMLAPEVIVFRPEPKASLLVDTLCFHNISALAVEPFAIEYIPFEIASAAYTDIIFTSTYAVESFFSAVPDHAIMVHATIWTVGSVTALALHKHGIKAHYPDKADSEHLLAILSDTGQSISDRHFLLIKGVGGRELLTNVLQQQAASFSLINCYERKPCDKRELLRKIQQINWDNRHPRILLYTSFDALKASMPIFEVFSDWQQKCTVTVTNRRMLDWAKRQGFVKLYLLENLTHDQLVAQIIKLR
ncbi:uroporphyrinogen-III synthase [Cysteiniphilum sp. 6C5]|uniref:uroporphyrinogen-III synthase n=1 Tax=unclassified Cysteiniphilum TaxID=2610889 RepID=UPI003F86D0E9